MEGKYQITKLSDGYGFTAMVYGGCYYSCAYIVRSKGDLNKVAERNARAQPWDNAWKTREEAETAVKKHKNQFPS